MGRKNRREWGKEVEIGKMRGWVRGIAVAEGEGELPKEASRKRSRRCTMSESAWFPVQEQCGKGAQAVDGHSANSIILLVAKFKTQQLWDCECYIQGLIFILSLWGRTFAYKSVYRSVYKTINHSKPGLKVTEQWPRACAREFESDSSWQLFKFPREHWLSALYWRPGHVRTHTRPLRAGRDSQQSWRKVQNWGATVSESGLVNVSEAEPEPRLPSVVALKPADAKWHVWNVCSDSSKSRTLSRQRRSCSCVWSAL